MKTVFAFVLLLAYLCFRPAFAQDAIGPTCYDNTLSFANCTDAGHATAALNARLAAKAAEPAQVSSGTVNICMDANSGPTSQNFATLGEVPAYGKNGHLGKSGASGPCTSNFVAGSTRWYPVSRTCAIRDEEFGWQPSATNVCHNGCSYGSYNDPVTGQTYFSTLNEATNQPYGVCTTGPTPVPDRDHDGIPDSEDAFPDDPGEQADADGDGIGDNADFAPDDPTDGKDGEGEEDGDDEGDNEASGGGTCDAPPVCSGDGIQCAQLYQQWKIRCSGAVVTGQPEICNASYSCTGDSAQCAQVALLRKTACTVEAWDGNGSDPGGGSDAAQELVDGLKNGPADQNVNPMSIWHEDDEEADADDAGYGLARVCPSIPQIFGKSIDTAPLCNLGGIIAAIVLLAGFVQFGYAFVRS